MDFGKVLARITPAREERERVDRLADALIERIRREVPKSVGVELMGSLAKGTNLKGTHDFDIFMLFPRSYSHREMAMLGLHYAKKAMAGNRWEVGYAEHPYLRALVQDCKVDVVPCFRISEIGEKGSSVDRSQLHTKYVNKRMGETQRGGVRLLKKFLRTLGVYGAELRVEGFSGYLCELLVLRYGSFEKALQAAAKWDRPVIDIEGQNEGVDLRKVFDAALIVIDPVDRNRNVAAVVSQTSMNRFVLAARQFLKKPGGQFFFRETEIHGAAKLRKIAGERGTEVIVLKFCAPPVVDDVLWPQLKKTSIAVAKALQEQGFGLFGYYHWSAEGECVVLLELENARLPAVKKVIGPEVRMEKAVENFLAGHRGASNVHIEHDRIVAVEKRRVRDAKDAIVKILREAGKIGVPGNFQPLVKKAKIAGLAELMKDKYREIASDYFTRSVV